MTIHRPVQMSSQKPKLWGMPLASPRSHLSFFESFLVEADDDDNGCWG
jgi:hypothetical protein